MTFIQRRNNVDVDAGVDLTAILFGGLGRSEPAENFKNRTLLQTGFFVCKNFTKTYTESCYNSNLRQSARSTSD